MYVRDIIDSKFIDSTWIETNMHRVNRNILRYFQYNIDILFGRRLK